MPTSKVEWTVGGVWVSKRRLPTGGGSLESGGICLCTSGATSRFEHLAPRIQERRRLGKSFCHLSDNDPG